MTNKTNEKTFLSIVATSFTSAVGDNDAAAAATAADAAAKADDDDVVNHHSLRNGSDASCFSRIFSDRSPIPYCSTSQRQY